MYLTRFYKNGMGMGMGMGGGGGRSHHGLDRVVWIQALAGGTLCCVLGQDTLLSQCLSPPRCKNGYRGT